MVKTPHKLSYTVPCGTDFRDSINALSEKLNSNVADLARSILLILPEAEIRSHPDPGGPKPTDRENIIWKTGATNGKTQRRKPRLQVRLRKGYDVSIVRKALNIALQLERGTLTLSLNKPPISHLGQSYTDLAAERQKLKNIISELAFEPIMGGITNFDDALHVLGFAPNENPDKSTIQIRFRKLAAIHHPDSTCGNHQRMTQINAAKEFLCK